MKLSPTLGATSAVFDDPNLVSSAGLVPTLALAERAGLGELADQPLSVPTDKGANAGLKVSSLSRGVVAGADSIDDMALLRHGGMGRIFTGAYAPSTLGSFLRSFTFGHVRQLDAVASRFLLAPAGLGGLFTTPEAPVGTGEKGYALLDVDDTLIQGPRLRQAGGRVRLHPGLRDQRAAGHLVHHELSAGDRGSAVAQGSLQLLSRREAAGR